MALIKFGLIVWFVVWGLGLMVAYPPLFFLLLVAWVGYLFLRVVFEGLYTWLRALC